MLSPTQRIHWWTYQLPKGEILFSLILNLEQIFSLSFYVIKIHREMIHSCHSIHKVLHFVVNIYVQKKGSEFCR